MIENNTNLKNVKEDVDNRERRRVGKELRGMKERFRSNNLSNLQQSLFLFQKYIYKVYQWDDFHLIELAQNSYRDIEFVLKRRLENRQNKQDKLETDIRIILFAIQGLMLKFYSESISKHYD